MEVRRLRYEAESVELINEEITAKRKEFGLDVAQ